MDKDTFYNNISNLKSFFTLSDEEFISGIYSDHSDSRDILSLNINLLGNQVLVKIYYDGNVPEIICLNNPELGNELNNNFIKEYYS